MSTYQSAHYGLETWTRDLRAACGHFDTELAFNRSLFIGEVSKHSRGGLSLANLRTNAGLIKRERPNADHDMDQHCFLVSQRSGYCQITQNGQVIQRAGPSAALGYPSAGPSCCGASRFQFHGSAECRAHKFTPNDRGHAP